MKKIKAFEYLIHSTDDAIVWCQEKYNQDSILGSFRCVNAENHFLNHLGSKGWELVVVTYELKSIGQKRRMYFLKREKFESLSEKDIEKIYEKEIEEYDKEG